MFLFPSSKNFYRMNFQEIWWKLVCLFLLFFFFNLLCFCVFLFGLLKQFHLIKYRSWHYKKSQFVLLSFLKAGQIFSWCSHALNADILRAKFPLCVSSQLLAILFIQHKWKYWSRGLRICLCILDTNINSYYLNLDYKLT